MPHSSARRLRRPQGEEVPVEGAHEVAARYDEPHRRYHTGEHLREVLDAFESLRDLCDDEAAVADALLWHDAVYDPQAAPGANERESAALAREAGCSTETARLIELTAGHAVEPGDRNGGVVADCDLWILGAPPTRYRRYAADVRAEYAHVDDEAWRAGRAAVLRSFLDRPSIYVTGRARDRWEAQARANLSWELASISST